MLEQLVANAGRNTQGAGAAPALRAELLKWGAPDPLGVCGLDAPADVILATGCVYGRDKGVWEALVGTLVALSGPGTLVVMAHGSGAAPGVHQLRGEFYQARPASGLKCSIWGNLRRSIWGNLIRRSIWGMCMFYFRGLTPRRARQMAEPFFEVSRAGLETLHRSVQEQKSCQVHFMVRRDPGAGAWTGKKKKHKKLSGGGGGEEGGAGEEARGKKQGGKRERVETEKDDDEWAEKKDKKIKKSKKDGLAKTEKDAKPVKVKKGKKVKKVEKEEE